MKLTYISRFSKGFGKLKLYQDGTKNMLGREVVVTKQSVLGIKRT